MIPAKWYVGLMLSAGLITLLYGIGTGDANTILGGFLFIGIGGGIYLIFNRQKPYLALLVGKTEKALESEDNETPISPVPVTGPVRGLQIPVHALAERVADVLVAIFSTDLYFSVFVSQIRIEGHFPKGWTRDDALARWYSLGLICLTHCSKKTQWTDTLSLQGGMDVHDATITMLWSRWRLTDDMRARVREFMHSNIKEITSSLHTVVSRQAQDRWFTHYTWRLVYGMTVQWSISKFDIKNPPLCDAFDTQFGEVLRTVFNDASISVLAVIGDNPISIAALPTNDRLNQERREESDPAPKRIKLTEMLGLALPGNWIVIKRRERTNVFPSPKPGFEVQTPEGYRFRKEYSEGYEYRHEAHSRHFDDAEEVKQLAENIQLTIEKCPPDCDCRIRKDAEVRGPCVPFVVDEWKKQ